MDQDWANLDDGKTVLNVGRTGVFLSAIEGDIRSLLRSFQKLQTYDFESFGKVWKDMNFSLIHFVATEKHARNNLMQCLYRTVLSHFRQGAILEIKVGVVYALYLLYYTQPSTFGKSSIRVTMDMWKMWSELYVYCKDSNMREMVYCIDRMRDDSVFEFVAWIDDNEGLIMIDDGGSGIQAKATGILNQIERSVMASSQGGIADPITSKRRLELVEEYIQLKKRLLGSNSIHNAAKTFYNQTFGESENAGDKDQGPENNQDDELPAPIPLDTTYRELEWWNQMIGRVKKYQRVRSERAGTGTNEDDDGSLRMLADYSTANNQMAATGQSSAPFSLATTPNTATSTGRGDFGQIDYQQERTFMSAPLRATLRSLQRQNKSSNE
ncbi:hypothetical protein H4219_000450 [Mycoemilia scoparia]|uniref:Uncharacterized protein n=1 Tax=Mycoemilia scoparia TaxID=417184 RepID=A0A9W8DWY4_9FUNG|nr:hypothetical protein H4219_000450 [Mycoemilia scoparia]